MKRARVFSLLPAVVVAVMTSTASARRVVHIPTLAELCPGNGEWNKVAECVKRQAPFKLLRDEAKLKLLRIDADRRHFGGYYIYTYDKQWKLYGSLPQYQAADMLAFEPVTYGVRSGYRVDIGVSAQSGISLDGETTIPAEMRYRMTALCFGGGYCTQFMTACDVLVRGRAYYTFRGKLWYENKQLKVIGDRSRAGPSCVQHEVVMVDQ